MRKLYTHKVTDFCGSGTIWIPSAEYRAARYESLKKIAAKNKVHVHLCRCKNKDTTTESCHPAIPEEPPMFTETFLDI